MKMEKFTNRLKVLIGALILVGTSNLFAQTSTTVTTNNTDMLQEKRVHDKRMLNNYTAAQLDQMYLEDPETYKALEYYYTKSYVVENIECFECTPLDLSTFNIADYEHTRDLNVTKVWESDKQGIRITFVAVKDLEYKLPVHLARIEFNR